MSTLRISLFGGVRIRRDGTEADLALAPSLQLLFAYLLLNRKRGHSRELLAEHFWSESDSQHARAALSTALWRLRRELHGSDETGEPYLALAGPGEIRFNLSSDYWLDVADFEEKIELALPRDHAVLDATALSELERALRLYRGDLLEGFYADWALRERERLRLLYLSTLAHLTHHYRCVGQLEKAIETGQAIVAIDPLREEIHRELMRTFCANGQRSMALRQYQICRSVLQEELAVEPMEETQELWERIRQHAVSDREFQSDSFRNQRVAFTTLQQELSEARSHFDALRQHLDAAIQLAGRIEEEIRHARR